MKETDYSPRMDENGAWKSNDELAKIIERYCNNNYDILSGRIYETALGETEGNNIQVDINENANGYKENVKKYEINKNLFLTITPDEIYLDELIEKPIPHAVEPSAKASWKYKNVATRRTLFKKVTLKGETYTFKIYSVHTGGEVKYNGSTAKHSAAYYAYNTQETYGSPFTFKNIAKQSEQISGTSWHYKYLGKVTGSISVTTPIKLTITFKEKALGCQVITSKDGKVTKHYWPAL